MKSRLFALALVFSCIGIHCMAQQPKFLQQETDRKGNVSYAVLSTDTFPQTIGKSAELLKNMYSIRNADEFKPSEIRKEIRDELGFTHQYYHQYYRNVRVEDGEATVHSDKQGNIETIFGYFKLVGDVNTEPKFTEAQALEFALKHIGAVVYKWQIPEEEQWIKEYFNDTYRPVGELVIAKDRLKTDNIYRLAYRFDIYAHKPVSRNYVWVDAITGDILNVVSRIMNANATGTAATRYSGTRSITADSFNGSFRLRETRNGVNISTFNMNRTGNYTSTDFTDNDNNWTAAEHSANNNNAGLDAHWGAEMVYAYFKQVHWRNSWNNSNGPLLSYVNANLIALGYNDNDNAFWDGNKMTYGQGTSLPPLTTLDICAHEIGHAVCQSTANLLYQGESGAINESLSDIWAACVESWATTGKQTWLIGEDLGWSLRSMSNPNTFGQPDTYGGINWFNTNGCTPTRNNDFCGVHSNSGVMNYWFYLLSEGGSGTNDNGAVYSVVGLGIEKTAKILYRAETVYMTANTDFANARQSTITAATSLYGTGSGEVVSVINAWHAVGVGDRHPNIITGSAGVCPGTSKTFTAHVLGAVTWTCSSNLNLSVNGSAATITNNDVLNSPDNVVIIGKKPPFLLLYPPRGWVKATISGTSISVEKHFDINTIPILGFDLPSTGNASNILILEVTASIFDDMPTQVYWSVSPNQGVSWYSYGNPTYIGICQNNTYTVTASTENQCGTYSASKNITVTGGYPYPCHAPILYSPSPSPLLDSNSGEQSNMESKSKVDIPATLTYPNPVSNVLTIEIDRQASEQKTTDGKQLKQEKTYDIRLYDNQGNMLRRSTAKGGSIQFNVANLPNGIYYLHIYDGVSEKPEMRQIVVEH